MDRLDVLRQKLSRRAPRPAICILAAAWAAMGACGDAPRHEAAVAAASAGEGGAPYLLDSALKIFRVDLEPVGELQDAETSIDRVVRRFARTIEQSDTAALRAIMMTRREFAFLYYPTSPFTRAPTKQEPGLVWFLHMQNSQKGATRLLDRFGGRPIPIVSNACKPPARREGDNVLWDDCVQRVLMDGDTVSIRLFGGVYERNGRFKIFSYSNDL